MRGICRSIGELRTCLKLGKSSLKGVVEKLKEGPKKASLNMIDGCMAYCENKGKESGDRWRGVVRWLEGVKHS